MANTNLTNTNTPAPLNSSLTVMNNILRVIKNGIIAAQVANGVTNPVAPDVGPASFAGLLARGVGNEVANATAYSQAAFNLQMPDTATGANLNRWLNIYNIPRRNASSSFGTVVGTTSPTSASTFIPAGTQLTAPSGTRYQVQTSGTYGNGSTIPLIAIDTGSITNQEVGVTLQWVSTPAYFSSTVTVNNALEGGVDAETDGVADSRLLAFPGHPECRPKLYRRPDSFRLSSGTTRGNCRCYRGHSGHQHFNLSSIIDPHSDQCSGSLYLGSAPYQYRLLGDDGCGLPDRCLPLSISPPSSNGQSSWSWWRMVGP
jgi:hypothetical protein